MKGCLLGRILFGPCARRQQVQRRRQGLRSRTVHIHSNRRPDVLPRSRSKLERCMKDEINWRQAIIVGEKGRDNYCVTFSLYTNSVGGNPPTLDSPLLRGDHLSYTTDQGLMDGRCFLQELLSYSPQVVSSEVSLVTKKSDGRSDCRCTVRTAGRQVRCHRHSRLSERDGSRLVWRFDRLRHAWRGSFELPGGRHA